MSRITETMNSLSKRGEKALVTYITGGYPSLELTEEMLIQLANNGADIIEIGIPFSDPVADGPVIQSASYHALEGGTTVKGILEMIGRVRKQISTPLVLMSYYNPILQMGLERFCRYAAENGVDGLIVPDLPIEEAGPLLKSADHAGLELVPLVAPTSTPERIAAICDQARGFVYCVSVAGVTGERQEIRTDLASITSTIRQCTSLPRVIGFGVGDASTARTLASLCDGVVVGSAIVRLMTEGSFKQAEELIREIRSAINQ